MTCPANPPPPAGYTIWKGPVPALLTQWAIGLRDNIRGFPYGQTWTLAYGGQAVVARKDYHTFTYKNGVLLTGICIPGITLYAPLATAAVGASGPPGGAAPLLSSADQAAITAAGQTAVGLDTTAPDPDLALYPAAPIDWGLVALSGGAALAVGGLFLLALRHAGSSTP